MSGEHLLSAGLDGRNTMIFAKGENGIKAWLAVRYLSYSLHMNTRTSFRMSFFRCKRFCIVYFKERTGRITVSQGRE